MFSIFPKHYSENQKKEVQLAKEICEKTSIPFSFRDSREENLKEICFVEVSSLKANPRHSQLIDKGIIHISDVVRIYPVDESNAKYLNEDKFPEYKNIQYSEKFKTLINEIIEYQDIKTRLISFFNSRW